MHFRKFGREDNDMIGVDWGTTAFRAFRVGRDGTIRDRRASPRGIQNVPDGRFGDTLREEIGPWLALGEDKVLLSGMIGSRQGWKETPYLPCPAGPTELAAALADIGFDWARVKLVPGLSVTDESGVAEVMRGEETQVMGVPALLRDGGVACLPGTHSKWVRVEGGRITGFTTHMTGEAFGALRGHTILARMMRDGPSDGAPFEAGLARSAEPGGLLHHLFGVRALTLADRLQETEAPAYLSGILIGHEVRAALAQAQGAIIQVIGAPELTALYARAIADCGGYAERHDGEAAARGLALIAGHAQWT
jgi:2-dehydro-3-deoxygalactonokinase